MKTKITGICSLISLCIASLALFAFMARPGTDNFEVFLNQQLLMEEHLHDRSATRTISLEEGVAGQLRIMYNQCGETGISRKIILKNDQQKILEEWSFKDVEIHTKDAMAVDVSDITKFRKSNGAISLSYRSNNRDEVVLVMIQWADKTASND